MPDIPIEQSTFERLLLHARPPLDTTDKVINHALDALELREGDAGGKESATGREFSLLDELNLREGDGVPDENPSVVKHHVDPGRLQSWNLTHTKIQEASISEEHVVRPKWNHLLREILIRAMKRHGDFDYLRQICPRGNIMPGRHEGKGYRYIAEIKVSIQSMDVNHACAALVDVARGLEISLEIIFIWRHKKGAMHPGEKARLYLPGKPR